MTSSKPKQEWTRRELVTAAAAAGVAGTGPEASSEDRAEAFPQRFTWGVATAAYQVEGAPSTAGGGRSIWDTFTRKPGAVKDGSTGDVACDHYRRFRQDIALMKDLGVQGYRFSISWPRVLPDGVGQVNSAGLDFYDRLVEGLLSVGIPPYVTLFHWDLPDSLHRRGGWLNPDSPAWFAEFAQVVARRLAGRVRHWITLNEPQVFWTLGYQKGTHAPGEKLALPGLAQGSHHILLAHARAVQTLRAAKKGACQIGFATTAVFKMPASERPADVAAARRAQFSAVQSEPALGLASPHFMTTSWWLDPIFSGRYPEDGLRLLGKAAPKVVGKDLDLIRQPLDFLGVNVYFGGLVRAGWDGEPEEVSFPPGIGINTFGFPVTPEALYWGPRFLHERYRTPLSITENGVSISDWVALDGKVHDPQRIDFLRRYLLALRRAVRDGVDVRGYFHWSLMDNFEWADGFRQRFGLFYVDFLTQHRTPKDSAAWYRDVIRTDGASLGG